MNDGNYRECEWCHQPLKTADDFRRRLHADCEKTRKAAIEQWDIWRAANGLPVNRQIGH